MTIPRFTAEASLYQTAVSYHGVARDNPRNLVSPQIAAGGILGTVWCYGGCVWRYLICISTCRFEFECATCEAHLALCPLVCGPIVIE
jgi:hypothetical protein